jgi:hypothetical protein
MEYPDQLKTPVRNDRPGTGVLDDFLWETASWDPALERLLEQEPTAAARQLLDEQLVTEPGTVYRLVRLLAEAGELGADHLAPLGDPPGGSRPGSGADPLGGCLPLTGRETEHSLGNHAATRHGAGVSVVCITGPAGIGKTRLARAIATATAGDQLEVSLSRAAPGPENRRLARTPHDALADLLVQLGVREADMPASLAERRTRYTAELADRRPVLVVDGVVDESQVLPLLPPRQGSVVVTSRAPLPGLNNSDAAPLALGPLSQIGSRQLIRQVFATFDVEADHRVTDALYELCAGVPGPTILAARWLATAARTERLSAQTLLERMPHARDGEAASTAVLRLLGEDQQAVVRALGLLQLPEADLWTVCLSTGLSQDRARAALDQLTGMGLVGPGGRDQTWVAASLAADCARAPGQLPQPRFEDMLGPVIGVYGRRAESLRDLISAPPPGSPATLAAWAEERWRAERAGVSTVLGAAADSERPALARGLATTFMDLAEHGDGRGETEASAAAVLRVASAASDPELQARALRALDRQTQLHGEMAQEPAGKPAQLVEPAVTTVPRTPLGQVTEAVRRDLTERLDVPLLFGGLTGHDR